MPGQAPEISDAMEGAHVGVVIAVRVPSGAGDDDQIVTINMHGRVHKGLGRRGGHGDTSHRKPGQAVGRTGEH